jgi:hypothetical protein
MNNVGLIIAIRFSNDLIKNVGVTMKQLSSFGTTAKLVTPFIKTASIAVTLIAAGLMTACSSSNDSNDARISGTIVAGPVDGAEVGIVDGSGNEVVAPVTTDADGKYSLAIPNGSLGQDLIVKSSGGSFTDEATLNSGTAGDMYAYLPAGSISNGNTVSVTPGSSIVAQLVMDHGMTMTEASDAFEDAFAYMPDVSVDPADATSAPAADETEDETLAGFRAGAFSQLANDLGLSQDDQFELFAALAQDLSDEKLDGVDASGVVAIGTTGESLEADIQNRFSMALVNFRNNPNNMTGLDNNEIGDIPFAKVALTDNYQIEYKPLSLMAPVNGKDTFQIHVTNRSDGSDAPGLTNMLMPMMYMLNGYMHSTPMPAPAITDDGKGLYTVTLYYLMPTAMGGYWDLKFMIEGEETHFYPTVMMAMEGADTPQVRLYGVDDQVMTMTGMSGRTYFIFKESLMPQGGTGKYDFSVFIASLENMMSFPAVFDGSTLDGKKLDVTVEIDDGTGWKPANGSTNDGVWRVEGLTLTDGVADEIRVRLTVNDTVYDEIKTTDGEAAVADGNDYQTFTVTPGGM